MRRAVVVLLLVGIVAAIAGGATYFSSRGKTSPTASPRTTAAHTPAVESPFKSRLPAEIRGLHVTEGLASLPGKIEEYMSLSAHGLNAIELDVKDENGYVGFVSAHTPKLARAIGSARTYYDAAKVAALAHAKGLYLIGRVVVFQDPTLTDARSTMAIQNTWGGVWKTSGGLGWANEYDQRVWKYNVDIAVAAAKAGFDEIQFDYVRFPTDGDLTAAVWPHKVKESRSKTIERFFRYAAGRLHPLRVRVSADLFGLAATRDMGIGQSARRAGRVLDTIYPMVYPSHFNPGEFNLLRPEAFPYATVVHALRDFKKETRGQRVHIVPWLQDFSISYTYGKDEVAEQIDAARAMSAAGFLLWNPTGVYTPNVLAHSSP